MIHIMTLTFRLRETTKQFNKFLDILMIYPFAHDFNLCSLFHEFSQKSRMFTFFCGETPIMSPFLHVSSQQKSASQAMSPPEQLLAQAERLSKKQGRDFEDNSVNQQCAVDEDFLKLSGCWYDLRWNVVLWGMYIYICYIHILLIYI